MRLMIKLGLVAVFPASVTACSSSPIDPGVDIVAETVGTEFVLQDRTIAVPVSITNLSGDASYYVWMGPGGLCAALDRLGSRGWVREGDGTCHPSWAAELEPGERLESQVWMGDQTGVFRFRLRVNDEMSSSQVEAHEGTNAFTIRPTA